MSDVKTGGCMCGSCRYEIKAQTSFNIVCYCRDCQQISGSNSLPQMIVDQSDVVLSGPVKKHSWKSDSGNTLTLAFCNDCGSPLYKHTAMADGKFAIAVGTLDEPGAFAIHKHVFESRRVDWQDDSPK